MGLDSQRQRRRREQVPVALPGAVSDRWWTATRGSRRSSGSAQFFPTTMFYDADGKQQYIHQGPYTSDDGVRGRHQALRLGPAAVSNEVRVDPLTGLKTIVAGGRAERPGGWPIAGADAAPIDAESDPFAPGHEDRTPPEVAADRAGRQRADAPGWRVRVVPNLYPALGRGRRRTPSGSHAPDLFTATRRARRARGDRQRAGPVTSLGDARASSRSAARWRCGASGCARTRRGAAYVHLLVNERAEGGASLPHTHAQLYALDFVPAQVARERERFGAYAVQHDGRQPAGEPRRRGGPASASGWSRSTTRS